MNKNNKKRLHIAVSGNIGAGKTLLAEKLARHYQMEKAFEPVEQNPYLGDFYMDMPRWAFNIQMYFLHSRFRQNLDIQKSDKNVIQDRSIYEDAHVFAKNLNQSGYLQDRDYQTYLDFYSSMSPYVAPPDLMIYLRAGIPRLVENIQERGRAFENSIRLDYLRDLNSLYEQWVTDYSESKQIIVEADHLDFDNNVDDFANIINLIEAEIHGLFN